MVGVRTVSALTVSDYDPLVHDRFESGFPNAPVENSSSDFIGKDYDWSGVGWSTNTAASPVFYKNHGMLSPVHFLTAQHFENTNASGSDLTQGIRVLGKDGAVYTAGTESINNLGHGVVLTLRGVADYDLAIGRLQTQVASPSQLTRYAVLDLHTSSTANSTANYVGLDVLHYGRGGSTDSSPRIASAPIDGFNTFNSDPNQLVFRSARNTGLLLEAGDSASPALHGWTNPNGEKELSVLGVNSATNDDFNFMSFLASPGAMSAANSVMVADGFALKIRGNPARNWVGSSSNNITNRGAWGLGGGPPLSGDDYVAFNGATAGNERTVVVDANHNLRGLYFLTTAASDDGFNFSGSSTLTIGRGGITNYDNARQVFSAPIALGDHQYWDVGSGGVTVANLNTNGRLLEIAGAGTAIVNGAVSGAGGLALSGQRLELHGNNSYTGATWVHSGRLHVTGDSSASSGVRLAPFGSLSGTGTVSLISGAGSIHPGQSPGILTASAVDLSAGLSFFFEFTQLAPDYGSLTASGNDVLYLTDSSPFIGNFSASNAINVFFNLEQEPVMDDSFEGGFFVVVNPENLSISISDATFNYYIVDPEGGVAYDNINYRQYDGPLTFTASWAARTVLFEGQSETVDGYSLKLTAVPEPASLFLPLLALLVTVYFRQRSGA